MNVNVVVRNVSSYTLVYSTQISMEKRSARVIMINMSLFWNLIVVASFALLTIKTLNVV